MKIFRITISTLLAIAMTLTMMPWVGGQVDKVYSESDAVTVSGGVVTVDVTNDAKTSVLDAFKHTDDHSSAVTVSDSENTLTIQLTENVVTNEPIRFVMGTAGKKAVLDLNGHKITGRAGEISEERDVSAGGNAIEIAADQFEVEIKGPGSVIGGKGGKFNRPNYSMARIGDQGGSAVFFCERVDTVHRLVETDSYSYIDDEGYHPDELKHGLTVIGGANLVGGDGGDITLEDWKYNLGIGDEDYFKIFAGKGGSAIGQIFSDASTEAVLEELSYARIIVEDGTVVGGAGGNVNLGGQLLTTTEIQKIAEIQQFMQGKSPEYDFDSYVTDNIQFKPADGGNGIEFFAGRKYIEVRSDGTVSGGSGGMFTCSETASMVKRLDTKCGDGGKGSYICGDTGLTNTKPSLTADSWTGKTNTSEDIGVYIAGTVTGGASPSTTLLGDSAGAGGEGIESDLNGGNLCSPYTIEHGHRPTFDEDRGIVLVANGGKVTGGAAGAPNERNISGGLGADAMTGGSTGGPTGGTRMSAAYFIINGDVVGGYGSSQGGNGFHVKEEAENLDETQSSVFFGGVVYGNGTITGGDSGKWPHIGISYTADSNGVITEHLYDKDRVVQGEGILLKYGSHEGATTIGSGLSVSDGVPAKLMSTAGTFSVTPSMTPFAIGTAPNANTKLSCKVTTPDGYNGKVYIMWSAEYENSNPRIIRTIEGANGAYNNFGLLSNSDYPYGWKLDEHEYYTNYTYHINVATTDHIAESIKYNDSTEVHIYCHVLLEDGRFIDNDDIWFSKERRSEKGWAGGSGGPTQEETDQEAADNVLDMLIDLPGLGSLTLEDADAVAAVRAAYEALTPSQQALLESYTFLQDLEAAEAKIAQLQGAEDTAEAEKVENLITALTNPEQITLEDEAAVIAAREAYDKLTDSQKAKIPQGALDKLEAAEGKINQLNQDAVEEAENQISGLLEGIKDVNLVSLNPDDPDDAAILSEAKDKIEQAVKIYNQLTDNQKDMVDSTVKEQLSDAVGQYNAAFPDTPIDDPTIEPTAITEGMITVANATYTGKALTPAVTVKDGDKVLTEGTDYTKTYSNNVNAGKGKVTVTGEGDYKDTATKEFTISPKAVTPSVSLSAKKYTYNAKARKPGVTVKVGTVKLAATQYTVSYAAGRKNVGTYKVTVNLKGNYKGTKAANFTIVPKGATIVKPAAAKKAITVKWKKQAAKMSKSRITGYQVQCCTNKKFKSGVKKKTVKGYKKTAVKVSKLKSKKTYYVRVRTYMKTGGKTYYSNWSKAKAVKAK